MHVFELCTGSDTSGTIPLYFAENLLSSALGYLLYLLLSCQGFRLQNAAQKLTGARLRINNERDWSVLILLPIVIIKIREDAGTS